MAAVDVKNDSERMKMILAIVLGVLALLSLLYAFGGSFFSNSTRVAVTTATPTPSPSPGRRQQENFKLPEQNEVDLVYQSTPINYYPGVFSAPDPGRNVFAFYEPPPPCTPGLNCPTPTPYVPTPAPPPPTPPVFVAYVTPQSVYAGSKSFRLDVYGDRFDPATRIYFNGMEMPTSFVNAQRLSTDIPANLVSNAGPGMILVRTPDGRLFSNQVNLNIQPPPTPNFQYIGMIARQHANNDTAYFTEPGKQTPTTARLNDVLGGRFRLVSISAERTIFEDTQLGFRHTVNIQQPQRGAPQFGSGPIGPGGRGELPAGFPVNPTLPDQDNFNANPPVPIPGIPANIPRVNAPGVNARPNPQNPQKDKNDEDGTDGR